MTITSSSLKPTPVKKSASGANLTDWELSDFNLKSSDFNEELNFLCGNLFDLNFNYMICRILNYKCFLLKYRHGTGNTANNLENERFILKVRLVLFFFAKWKFF